MIKIQSNTATREPIPSFLVGLAPESLADLSWTDPALGVSDCAWWPEDDQSPALGEFERYGDETLTVDPERRVVVVVRDVVPLTAEELAALADAQRPGMIEANNAAYESAIAALTADYPPSEIATWERQRAEALAWAADTAAPTPWIDIAAAARGLDRGEYLSRTLAKAQAFAQASAWLTGRRQGIDDALRAATTPAELAAVVIDYTLPA
ncbi:hypothetical protein [Stutzerimonas stutzeri]|uniref:hypothetical protein n=1 Tax=Stutzerimonas stutzeri TaxID=316 RepID=UPI003EDF4D8E